MAGVDHANRAAAHPHHEALRRGTVGVVSHTAQQVAVGDSRGGKERVITVDEVVGGEHAAHVDARGAGERAVFFAAGPQQALNLAAERLDGGSRGDALWCAADTHQRIHAGLRPCRGNCAEDVAVADEFDTATRGANLADQVGVSRPIEHHDGQLAERLVLGASNRVEIVAHRFGDVDCAACVGPDGDLVHVHERPGVEHRAALGDGDHAERIASPERGERRAVDRVDRHVGHGFAAVADVLAVEEHRRFVFFAFADHDDAVHAHRVEQVAHRVDRRAVGGILVASSDPLRCCESRRFRHPHELHRQVSVGLLGERHRPQNSRNLRRLGFAS